MERRRDSVFDVFARFSSQVKLRRAEPSDRARASSSLRAFL